MVILNRRRTIIIFKIIYSNGNAKRNHIDNVTSNDDVAHDGDDCNDGDGYCDAPMTVYRATADFILMWIGD